VTETFKTLRFLAAGLLLLAMQPAAAQPRESLVPGGIAIVAIEADPSIEYRFRGKPVLVTKIDGATSAVIGLPLGLEPGEHYIEATGDGQLRKQFFRVADKQYTTQHITIQDDRKVNPYASDMQRILAEKKRKHKARNHYSRGEVDVDFLLPVEGINTGSFGRRRVFNGQPRRPHSGMDFAAPTGTPVHNPSPGKVIELGDFFFSGKLVYIDHGQGLISMFAHLNEINVELGQQVGKGEIVGKVGATGRVTGPHLHWSLGLNGTWIDPVLFLPE
jgi:murein DD-endopeptidase MepM/ murein hydrolase activator NlpD